MRGNIGNRFAENDVTGGVAVGALKNLDAAKIMGFSSALRDIADMNEKQKQQKIANLLSFAMWSPPTAMQSKSSSSSLDLSSIAKPLMGALPF